MTLRASENFRQAAAYLAVVLITFAVLQSVVVVMHELTHSTVAWLLGAMGHPFDIVWGNPLTMTGWDEGVAYSRLFPQGHDPAEAIIGASPLLVHALIVTSGLLALQRRWLIERKWLFHTLFWFVIANLMELVAYIVMRPFAAGGDTGHFNQGLALSPWVLFIAGTLLILAALYALYRFTLPRLYELFAPGNQPAQRTLLLLTSFFLFLWGSGIRVLVHIYPDPQWMFGLIGVAAFGAVLLVFKPSRCG